MHSTRTHVVRWGLFAGALASCAAACCRAAEPLPDLTVSNVRRAFHNGEHNAFTDLCQFGDRYYLTFRSCPDGHAVNPTSHVLVLASTDLRQWEEVFRFRAEKRDVRDPHFLIFRDQLFVYSGAWYCGDGPPAERDMNEHLGFAAWTADGKKWQGPRMLEGTYGHYIWRAAAHRDRAYLCGRRKQEFQKVSSRAERDPIVESALLESEDGLVWRTAGLFQKTYGNETAFLIEPDGQLLAVARTGGNRPAQVCRSQFPFQEWERSDLDRFIGGPLVVRWGSRYLVGGRQAVAGKGPLTTLYWLADNKLHQCARLPSGGDNSYPGFVALDDRRGVLSYYSSHERDADGKVITAIYLADLEIR